MTGAEKYLDEPYEGEENPLAARGQTPESRLLYLENIRNIYEIMLLRVGDDGTLEVLVQMGFGVSKQVWVRCAVYDASDTSLKAKAYTYMLLSGAPRVWLQISGRKGANWLGEIWFEDRKTRGAVSYREHMEARGYTRGAVEEPATAEADVGSTEADVAT